MRTGQACETPLVDLLRAVPEDAVAWFEHSPTSQSQIPYGRHCRDALAEIERLTALLAVDVERELEAFNFAADRAYQDGRRDGYQDGFDDGRGA